VASWKFFSDRIQYEEATLVEFFGDQYRTYKAKTPTGIPMIP
jgi:protein-S-isoprenylcysteine O-methyltransferase